MSDVALQMELITPGKMVLATEALSVTVPGLEGDFGVLPEHTPFLSMVRPGELEVETDSGTRQFVVAHGYAEVLPDRVVLLVDHVIPWEALNLEEAQNNLTAAQTALQAIVEEEDPDFPEKKKAVEFAAACVEVARKKLTAHLV